MCGEFHTSLRMVQVTESHVHATARSVHGKLNCILLLTLIGHNTVFI